MRQITRTTIIFMLIICAIVGLEIGFAKSNRETRLRELPYRMVMNEAMAILTHYGYSVSYPRELPQISRCSSCLAKREAFGAYVPEVNQIVMPDDFDLTTIEGHSTLIHEYGHFLLTKAGVPSYQQEPACVILGNSVMQKFFTANLAK